MPPDKVVADDKGKRVPPSCSAPGIPQNGHLRALTGFMEGMLGHSTSGVEQCVIRKTAATDV